MKLMSLPDSKKFRTMVTIGKKYVILGTIGNGYIIRPDCGDDLIVVLMSRFE